MRINTRIHAVLSGRKFLLRVLLERLSETVICYY